MGRPRLFAEPLTPAERARRYRALKRQRLEEARAREQADRLKALEAWRERQAARRAAAYRAVKAATGSGVTKSARPHIDVSALIG